jgi:3-phosphoshikimate 1-carboxyvinyltransferase
MKHMPDQVPTLAVLALFANSPTTIFEISHLRYKESNRLQALADELRKLGAKILVTDESILIHPLQEPPSAITLKTHNDHRLIMAFSILKLVYPHIELDDTKAVEKSNPHFFNEIKKLQGTQRDSN